MQTIQAEATTRRIRSLCLCVLAVEIVAFQLLGQDAVYPPQKPTPAKIESQLFVVGESVVLEQWTHTLKLVNAPQNVALLNPGQCIRVGIIATGDNRDEYFEETKLSFRVRFNGLTQKHPLSALAQTKQMKPEGGDFVTQVLAAGGIKSPALTMATMGVSADNWCVPSDATDGIATIEAETESPSGGKSLKPAKVEIESFDTGSKKSFKDAAEFSGIMQTYYRQPNPAQLLPVLKFIVDFENQNPKPQVAQGFPEEACAFLAAALRTEPIAAKDFLARIGAQSPPTRALGLLVLRTAGYDITAVLNTLSAEDKQKFHSLTPLADPYDLTPTREVFGHLDLMWSTFGATGEFKPINTIATTLSWRPDYDDFDRARKARNRNLTLTPSVVRGVAYTAAGWSLGSFQRNDPLAADYIEFMLASPDTSPLVKSELTNLSTNPAFKQSTGK
jgi:hypothetical protein